MRETAFPAHEQLIFGCGLTMVAGGLDAYSYLVHGQVFAGLQTGNLILLGTSLSHLQFTAGGRYLASLLAFALGSVIVRVLQHILDKRRVNRQLVVLSYMLVLLGAVLFLGQRLPGFLVAALLSLAAAAELQEFRQIKGAPFTPLMMTGNVRRLSESAYDGVRYRDKAARGRALDTATLMLSFIAGAFLVGLFTKTLGNWALLIPVLIVLGLTIWLYEQTRQRKWKH
ncbi:YoaK family protein [Levilactobacillus yonginensis]|uniref:YoaK family protein n=1 Tax=Levilactobacillus yonginensis TaxID=1054041 RepID=UPI00345C6DBF